MQFKKHIAIFLAFFLLVSNVGFALNVHYCEGQIASVSLRTAAPSSVEEGCCGAVEKLSRCCKDKVLVIQKKSDQAIVKSFSSQCNQVVLQQVSMPIPQMQEFIPQNINVPIYYCNSHAPPLFKLYSQYIFYDLV